MDVGSGSDVQQQGARKYYAKTGCDLFRQGFLKVALVLKEVSPKINFKKLHLVKKNADCNTELNTEVRITLKHVPSWLMGFFHVKG